ncbi:hypothetical protein DPMN_053743 [Dreissena polymorpha]|uniref:protein-tyrosine-phosphatase n=1 Tax=Dreissena polymorpha TaxID=45954 RepID=A0A9D4HSH1_DREPO|nr:hypothetical protein DPMN_053743 [Dreissena polymorpha]
MRRNRVSMIQTAEQYEFLHRALVHALTFDCAPVAADQLQNYVSKTGQQQREKQLKQLMSVSQHVVPEERINMARKKDVTALIEFRQRVLRVPAKLEGPTLVHCRKKKDQGMLIALNSLLHKAILNLVFFYISAGKGRKGRTGTYIALDILIHEGEDEEAVEIYGCVLNMRRNRVSMIQTAEQYEFLHRALVHALIFDCAPVAADQLQNYVSKTGQQQREKQLKQLILKNKNRPGADIPGDEYSPPLQVRSGAGDYINAVFIDSFKTKRHYIAAQSPLPGTVVFFLSLAYKEDCPCIVSFQHTHESKDVGMFYQADNQVLS